MEDHLHNAADQEVSWLPIDRITPRRAQAFGREDSASLHELAASIMRDGLIQPITVRPTAGGRYAIVSGNRRFLACRLAGMTHIDAIVLAGSDKEMKLQAQLERLTDGSLHYLEQADAIRSLIDAGTAPEALAEQLHCSAQDIDRKLRLAGLEEDLGRLVRSYGLPECWVQALIGAPAGEIRRRIAHMAIREHLGVSAVSLLAASAGAHAPSPRRRMQGRTIAVMRDYRLYMNAVRTIAAQMQEAGMPASFTEQREGDSLTMTISVAVRHRRALRHQVSGSSQAVQ